MQALMDHARNLADRAEEFSHLAGGQSPQALFITCSDSRVIPALITGARPGDLFELRTAGGIVPPYDPARRSGEMATIEYAVEILGVADIVVCGHSHCGAVGALVRGEDLAAAPAVEYLLRGEQPPALRAAADDGPAPGEASVPAVQEHVLRQLERLRDYPCVSARLTESRITLHGWCYEVHTGLVTAHRGGGAGTPGGADGASNPVGAGGASNPVGAGGAGFAPL
ncbi:carbonic anhydrase [Streptomyces sp. NPDC004647]|uniref:carbonic anhydrase n=1 Tax=Streptomyces sp. NPDC004647 TaxID=3154671 RepID=UPI0033B29230